VAVAVALALAAVADGVVDAVPSKESVMLLPPLVEPPPPHFWAVEA
jgi:hypothetical protein